MNTISLWKSRPHPWVDNEKIKVVKTLELYFYEKSLYLDYKYRYNNPELSKSHSYVIFSFALLKPSSWHIGSFHFWYDVPHHGFTLGPFHYYTNHTDCRKCRSAR